MGTFNITSKGCVFALESDLNFKFDRVFLDIILKNCLSKIFTSINVIDIIDVLRTVHIEGTELVL